MNQEFFALSVLASLLTVGLGIWISYLVIRTAIVHALIRFDLVKADAQAAIVAVELRKAKDEADVAAGIPLLPRTFADEFFDGKA